MLCKNVFDKLGIIGMATCDKHSLVDSEEIVGISYKLYRLGIYLVRNVQK